ncbi:MAG: hypothetical protein GY851_22760, partial [bacterium]|nr:hypothetical protein [bacterium]
WDFQGGGTIPFEIRVSPVKVHGAGSLSQKYRHEKYGTGLWQLDETTLRPIGALTEGPAWPAALARPESDVSGMQVRWRSDSGTSGEPGVRYVLRWETLGPNRDHARDVEPPASRLRLYKLSD